MTLYFKNVSLKQYYSLGLAALLLFFAPKGITQQLSFNKKPVEHGYQFTYQWVDFSGSQQQMSFVLSQEGLFDRFRNFKTHQASYAQRSILRGIKKHFRSNPIPGVQITYKQNHENFSIEAKGRDQTKIAAAYQEIQRVETTIVQAYFKESYYQTFTNHDQISAIKVDHVSVADDSVLDLKPLKPIILEIVSIQNIRKVTNYVLSFIQNIPYNPLESRITSSGAGFNPPLRVLWENQGDCDSKATLTASLLRALMPRIEMVLVFIDGHAFIGINIPATAGEMTIEHEDITYILAEPTGPALLPLGQLDPESELAINQGHYIAQNYHEVLTEKALEPE